MEAPFELPLTPSNEAPSVQLVVGDVPSKLKYPLSPDRLGITLDSAGRILIRLVPGHAVVVERGETLTLNTSDPERAMELIPCAMGYLLHQRGQLALHASAVSIDGRGVAFVGASGAGKSTIAAMMMSGGHAVLADDILPVYLAEDGVWVAGTGLPVRLAGGSAPLIGVERWDEGVKRRIPGPTVGRVPLARIWVLGWGDALEFRDVPVGQRVATLVGHTYSCRALAFGGGERHLGDCGKVANAVVIGTLIRPRGLELGRVVRAGIERHMR